MKYRISSRATILLGRESVSKVDGAIIELVKNTYDADATLCFIYLDVENDNIYILDNGIGMTKEVIENHWMLIGTDNKKIEYKSARSRIKSGEKGIGRFALDRLGSKCEMFTKNRSEMKLIHWQTDWSHFEDSSKNLNDIEADFEYLDSCFKDILPKQITFDIEDYCKKYEVNINLDIGTLIKVEKLRDRWTETEIRSIINSLGFLLPPVEQKDYVICIRSPLENEYEVIENAISDEYDYKLYSEFDADKFKIFIYRNEFDLLKIPQSIFESERFQKYPYRYDDFEKKEIYYEFSISELMGNDDKDYIESIKEIGKFNFNYIFMKLSLMDDSKEDFFYKEISKNRNVWMKKHGGIKIYRDNFLVRPYGDSSSDSYDWIGLDGRRARSPAGIGHESERWKVRNSQSQGTILISRVLNGSIIDKSSREGIIENEYFLLLKEVIAKIISRFEADRAYVVRTFKIEKDKRDNKEKTKEAGETIAEEVLSKDEPKEDSKEKKDYYNKDNGWSSNLTTLAKTVKFLGEEKEELITEIKLLRSLATNGLITTSIVHDLKGINSILVSRVETLNFVINQNDTMLISRSLDDLKKNDIFLKSWISVVSNQTKQDKRKRQKRDLCATVEEIVHVLSPILEQKKIKVEINSFDEEIYKKIFVSDFETIIYNLLVNSIESFERKKVTARKIEISIKTEDKIILSYSDSGSGLGDTFKDPYDIFKFGTSTKFDKDGNQVGTGLGMYIVASTLREYNAEYLLKEYKQSFCLEMKFPL